MPDAPPAVLLSAFADEATRPTSKAVPEQLAAVAAVGLNWYSPRWVQFPGGEPKHCVECTDDEFAQLRSLQDDFGVGVTSIGSRVGKVKLKDEADRSHNKFVPWKEYLDGEVALTVRAAHELGTKLIRGFSFYHPAGTAPEPHIPQAVDQLGELADLCAKEDLIYGLEIEPNLVGETGPLLATIAEQVNRPNLVLIWDGGNIAAQNKDAATCFAEYEAMRPYLGWIHIKDYKIDPSLTWDGYVDEERLKNFVPADVGDGGHAAVFKDLAAHLPELSHRVETLGVPGFYLELEPHLRGGGQFGGFSGPDGLGIACRALCGMLADAGIGTDRRDFAALRADRGF
ncbi:sugar phosphate isomerase/epimerase family protein [Alienimonas sp. DA493]|uniref:sugar phosphate isomerase/epimerase family protein n=1 Tax=Alienimonas sp. DA493 TaxID=3373605 RepID=UPI00375471D3